MLIGQARHRVIAALGAFGLAAGLLVWLAAPAGATSVSDETTFRAAWANAAETKIDLSADISLTCPGGGVAIRVSPTAITVDGHGHTIRQTCAANRVLQQSGAGALSFANVTITGGAAAGFGAAGHGGGIFAFSAPVTVTNSTISANSASNNEQAAGGGIFADSGPVTVTNSTISGNTANGGNSAFGGGIATNGAVTVTNSTITGNTASATAATGGVVGGGISGSIVRLVYATVVGNSATDGANIFHQASEIAVFTSFGSVVALPLGGGASCSGLAATSQGYNFSDDASCGFTAVTDKQNAGDPGLAALANNGGPTQTRLPQTGSPLIDKIPTASCQLDGATGITADQRGLPRPALSGCDIGAVEVQPAPVTTTTTTAPPPVAPPAAPVVAAVRFTG